MEKLPNISFKTIGFEVNEGFHFLELEHVFEQHPPVGHSPYKPHRINFFALFLLTEGEVVHKVDFTEYKVTPRDCLMISKEQIHAFSPVHTYKGYLILFSEEFMLNYFSRSAISKISQLYNYQLNPPIFYDVSEHDFIIEIIKKELALDLGEMKADILASILTTFLLKLEHRAKNKLTTYSKDDEQFLQFQKLVASKYTETRKARDYADQLFISYKQLNNLCKSVAVRTAKEYIDNYVVLETKRYLSCTNLSVKEMAYQCGFDEPTNFQKFFKNKTGITPAHFRDRYG